jgi:hypothetical protein
MSSSFRSGRVWANSLRHSALLREIARPTGPRLPDAQQPHPVESHVADPIELAVGNVVESRVDGVHVTAPVSQALELIWYRDG